MSELPGVLDTAPAYSPALQFNVRARYDFTAGEYKAFWSLGMNHTAHYRNEPESFPNGDAPNAQYTTTLLKYDIPGYDTYDGALGVAVEHLADELAQAIAEHRLAVVRRPVHEWLARLVDEHRALGREPAEQGHHGGVRELLTALAQLGAHLGDGARADFPQRLHDAELGRREIGRARHGYGTLV